MKKIIAQLLMIALLAVLLPLSTNAQTRDERRAARQTYNTDNDAYRRPNVYRRHRDLINVAAGTGGGAILGGLLGGRRGAGIGALLGAGGAALYTYKIRPKHRRD